MALFCGGATMTYLELDESSTNFAHCFRNQGLRPGDRVAIHWSNSFDVVQLFFALFKAGLIGVTINTRLKPPEISYILSHSEARVCFSEPALGPFARAAAPACPIVTELPKAGTSDDQPAALPEPDPEQPALILYTSGTTARPKGIVHTHRSLSQIGLLGTQVIVVPGDRGADLCVLPLMHAAAWVSLLASLRLKFPSVLLPRFDPGAVLDAIERFQCTHMVCMPALWVLVLEEQKRKPRQVSSLRTALAGGDAVSQPLQRRFEAIFGIPLTEGYGMTEAVPLICNPKGAIRSGAMGVPLNGAEVRIVDLSGHEVAEGESGEIIVRSPNICAGYWKDPEATRAAIRDGWLYTGDLGSRDANGYYWFRGRKKEIIIRAGSNISPQEVEEALCRHPAVLEAGVVGRPDALYGEVVVAFVVLRQGATAEPQQLRSFAQEYLADYKLPESILFLEALPKGPTGKVQRRALKEMI
ncbi:MAG: AMP-binding protein, partial [Acidobacteriia bacterium]|nr:AMP-binding protein [Terriglobia bacterium]